MGAAREQVEEFADSFQRLQGILDNKQTLVDYERALDHLRDAVGKGGGDDVHTEKGRAQIEALIKVVDTAIARSQKLKETHHDLAAQKMLTQALADLQAIGDKSPAMRAEMAKIRAELRKLAATKAEPKIDIATDQARSAINSVASWLAGLHDKTVNVNVNTVRTGAGGQGSGKYDYATGGYTGRGGKYEPAGIVHRGEVVLPQEVVKRDWASLKSRYGFLPGFADGGMVGNTHSRTDPMWRAAEGAAKAMRDLSGFSKKELEQRQRLLTNEIDRDKQRLDMLKQERDSLAEAVKALHRTDIFGGSGSEYPDWMTPEQIALTEFNNQQNALIGDTAAMRESLRLYKVLRRKGLDGPAFRDLVGHADVETLRQYANLSRQELGQYERRYERRDRVANRVGQYVGDAEYGRKIDRTNERLDEHIAEQKQTNRLLKDLHKAAAKDGPDRIVDGVGGAINGTAANAHRKAANR
jgi:uncharacterized small protein (DUF1192 family)